MGDYRVEKDTMGEVKVPADALWAAQTQRAVENFPISGLRFDRAFIRAIGLIKAAAAEANAELKLLDPPLAEVIAKAAMEVADGKWDDQFPLDIYQTGSGTSTNMNANEVIAARANLLLGGKLGEKGKVHANDHVNFGQSSNDVIPTAIHVAALTSIERDLLPGLRKLHKALDAKAKEFDPLVKTGRTHLQDATPIRLGQEFSGYASQVEHGMRRLENVRPHLAELAIGGTAVGTGLNAHPRLAGMICARLTQAAGITFVEAANHFEAQAAQDALVEASGALKAVAVSLMKISNDLRILSMGPRAGLQEITLPALQPGSSIMPGKVNPVILEMVDQVCAQVIGNDVAITVGGITPGLDLATMMPVMYHNLSQSIHLLAKASQVWVDKCITGITANVEHLKRQSELSTAIVTRLNPIIGYEKAAEIAKESFKTGKTIKELVIEKGYLTKEKAAELLDPYSMTVQDEKYVGAGGG
ncbi:MAG TPA: class II fumarate hydratase [Thermoplasmata archaeon]|nr:class II fumarate hydratase [Thermoplasmata archaeon]